MRVWWIRVPAPLVQGVPDRPNEAGHSRPEDQHRQRPMIPGKELVVKRSCEEHTDKVGRDQYEWDGLDRICGGSGAAP